MKALISRLWDHISRKRRLQICFLVALMAFVSLAEVASIGAIMPFLAVIMAPENIFSHQLAQPIIVVFGVNTPQQLMLPITIIFVGVALLSGLARLTLLWGQTRLSYSIGADLSIDIYRKTLYQPYAVHITRNSSEIISGISYKANVITGYAIMPLLTLINSVLIALAILAFLILINPEVALITIAGFGLVYLLVVRLTKERLAKFGAQISYGSSQVIKSLQEGLGGIRDVLIDGAQEIYCNAYRSVDLPLRRAQANIHIISVGPRFVVEVLGMTLIAGLAFFLADDSAETVGVIPVLGAFALGAQRLLPVFQQAYSGWISMRGAESILGDALALLEQPMPELAASSITVPFRSSIVLNDVSFRYAPHLPLVLRKIDLRILKGARIGFIGASGSGKSTLTDIIMGLLEPTEGIIQVDGQVIDKTNHRGWQSRVAHVPQSIFLADSSVAENIAFGVPRAFIDYKRVREAAQRAQIAEVIESWTMQYETSVGERGIKLSGGQRQRIGIARALYKQADLIIFDEATSALDNETENLVMQSIERLGKDLTILIVAHRLSTLKNCTQIIELSDGEIRRIGNYSEIVGAYQ
jgi:ATP-binding cassette subfamily B protein